jgi:hypothetical protein
MSPQQLENELRDALTRLETALDTPVIAGALSDWVQSVQKAFGTAAGALRAHFKHGHRQQFANIMQQDLELARRVEQLKEEDAAIGEGLVQLLRDLDCLTTVATLVGQNESRAQEQADQFVNAGLMFIARVRKQETAITTWLLEAFHRDQGPGD